MTKKQREAFVKHALAWGKAKDSRDKNLVRKITILERELDKLTIKAEKTIDPALKKESDETYQRYRKIMPPYRIISRKS